MCPMLPVTLTSTPAHPTPTPLNKYLYEKYPQTEHKFHSNRIMEHSSECGRKAHFLRRALTIEVPSDRILTTIICYLRITGPLAIVRWNKGIQQATVYGKRCPVEHKERTFHSQIPWAEGKEWIGKKCFSHSIFSRKTNAGRVFFTIGLGSNFMKDKIFTKLYKTSKAPACPTRADSSFTQPHRNSSTHQSLFVLHENINYATLPSG